MKTLQLVLSSSQYERLRREAEERCISTTDLVLEAVDAFLHSVSTEDLYACLARKQAAWRTWQEADHTTQAGRPATSLVGEQPAAYLTELSRSKYPRLADLRLDLIYHSEALEGSPLTRDQIAEAIKELSSQ